MRKKYCRRNIFVIWLLSNCQIKSYVTLTRCIAQNQNKFKYAKEGGKLKRNKNVCLRSRQEEDKKRNILFDKPEDKKEVLAWPCVKVETLMGVLCSNNDFHNSEETLNTAGLLESVVCHCYHHREGVFCF